MNPSSQRNTTTLSKEVLKKFKLEFEREVLQLLDEYELKIGIKGYMLQDIWENVKELSKKDGSSGMRLN